MPPNTLWAQQPLPQQNIGSMIEERFGSEFNWESSSSQKPSQQVYKTNPPLFNQQSTDRVFSNQQLPQPTSRISSSQQLLRSTDRIFPNQQYPLFIQNQQISALQQQQQQQQQQQAFQRRFNPRQSAPFIPANNFLPWTQSDVVVSDQQLPQPNNQETRTAANPGKEMQVLLPSFNQPQNLQPQQQESRAKEMQVLPPSFNQPQNLQPQQQESRAKEMQVLPPSFNQPQNLRLKEIVPPFNPSQNLQSPPPNLVAPPQRIYFKPPPNLQNSAQLYSPSYQNTQLNTNGLPQKQIVSKNPINSQQANINTIPPLDPATQQTAELFLQQKKNYNGPTKTI